MARLLFILILGYSLPATALPDCSPVLESSPSLSTARTRLAPLRLREIPAMARMLALPEIKAGYNVSPALAPFYLLLRSQMPSSVFFGIHLSDDDRLVGAIHMKYVRADLVEIGYFLDPSVQGRGLATEVLKRMTEYAFDELGVDAIQATVLNFNVGSMKVLEKAGFVHKPRKDGEGWSYFLLTREANP